ncbi:MAG: hypothetical protein OXI82_03015 [Nitrospinae bacterium]|nr:hypothetical protein [Nitrospinota bacterium]
MSDAKKRLSRLTPLCIFLALGAILSGCAGPFVPKVKKSSVKILKNAIEVEFTQLTREFDRLDQKGDLGLCAPLLFGVARYAVYQAVEEKRTTTMAQQTRFIMRARAAIKRAEEKMQKKQCVDTDGDGLTDLAEHRIHKTKPDNADTDGDKVSDSLEIRRYRTNPLKADTDGDLLDDGDEISRGLSPILADSDGDGFIDGIEIAHGSNARDACSQPLDAQYADRPGECGPKRIHAKPAQARTPKERIPAPAPKTKRTPDKKRIAKTPEPKAKPSPPAYRERPQKIEKAKSVPEKPKPPPTRNGAHPERKIQATQVRKTKATVSPSNAANNGSVLHQANANHTETPVKEPPQAERHEKLKANFQESPARANLEEPQTHAPPGVSLAQYPENTEKPVEAPPIPQSPEPAKKKTFPPASESFPSASFLRLW